VPPTHASLIVVYLTVFLDLLGFGILLPLMPYYAMHFGAKGLQLGALFAAFSVAQLVGAPLLGRLSDRLGRKPVLVASLLGSTIAYVATGLADSLVTLMAARALAGLFAGSIATAQAYVADVTTGEDRAKYMGLIGASIGMGFVFGPWIGSELSRFGFGTAAFAAAGLSLFNCCFAMVALRESRRRSGAASRLPLTLGRFRRALSTPVIGRLLIAGFVATFSFVAMEATFSLLGQRKFALDSRYLGRIFGGIGIVIVLIQGGLVGRLARRYGERQLALAGSCILGLCLAALPWMPTLLLTVAVLLGVAIGQGFLTPSLSSLLSRASGADEQGGVLGLGQSFSAMARASGPLIAGALFDRAMYLPYVLSACLMLLLAWLLSGLSARVQK
jgi:DHA1 family tetracycline resistance protein-like MFS transporter